MIIHYYTSAQIAKFYYLVMMSFLSKQIIRSFSTTPIDYGKRNFRNFILYKRGNKKFQERMKNNPEKDLIITNYGIKETTIKLGNKVVTIPEKIPDIIVPDLEGFQLKPYVSYRVPEVTQSEFTAKDLFNAVYRTKIVEDFKENKLKENGDPIEPNENELLTAKQAKIKARQTGSDLFSEGR
ncbi:39S ribosomal protein L41, mitochondrial [Daktulosphaira vitifoliae]|uniref:39S ribosomal protein L41, mitochondrial n=1 Tax=Daktulosphaira vitifoliae TaxID=58002 RepID=UPI0021AA2E10|nr:39S ribosomal protein L41, mitochondrial [Daktulosphaira vitifoliae]